MKNEQLSMASSAWPSASVSPVRLLAAATLVVVGLSLATGRAGAQEATATAVTPPPTIVGPSTTVSPSTTGEPSTTASPSAAAAPATTPMPSSTPVSSETPAPEPESPRLAVLLGDLTALKESLGDRLSDNTRTELERVRASLRELLGASASDDKALLRERAHDAHDALNGLRHAVQDDLHGLGKHGGGGLVADVRHDFNLFKHDLDRAIRAERREQKAERRRGRDDEPSSSPTAEPPRVGRADDDRGRLAGPQRHGRGPPSHGRSRRPSRAAPAAAGCPVRWPRDRRRATTAKPPVRAEGRAEAGRPEG